MENWLVTEIIRFVTFITSILENNGEQDWPSGCSLQYVSGDKLPNQTQIPAPPLPAMAQTDGESIFIRIFFNTLFLVSVELMSPGQTGLYSTKWSLVTSRGAHFGEPIWSIVQVEEGGTLTVTQMIDRM